MAVCPSKMHVSCAKWNVPRLYHLQFECVNAESAILWPLDGDVDHTLFPVTVIAI